MLEGLLIKDPENVADWCEHNLTFSPKVSATDPGPVSFSRQPYLREPLNAFADWNVEKVYLPMAAQTGKTTLLMCGVAWIIDNEPLPVLWATYSDRLAQSMSRNRMQPFIESNVCLKKHKMSDIRFWTSLEMSFDQMHLAFTGANSAANLSMRPIACAIMDEAAKYKHEDKTEAHPISLIEQRTKSFVRHLLVYASTPAQESTIFWEGYLSSDQREYFVPCPRCGEFIQLIINGNLRWDKPEDGGLDFQLVAKTARYVCQCCGGDIWEYERPDMLARGEWRATNPNGLPGVRGYHLNSLYSPYVNWGKLAVKLATAQNSLLKAELLQDFANSEEALPYTARKAHVRQRDVERLISRDYVRGEVPGEPYYLIASYDPGLEYTHWVVMAIGAGGTAWVIDWGTILGIRTKYRVWYEEGAESGKVQKREVETEGIWEHIKGLKYGGKQVDLAFVDSGYNTQSVYEECAEDPYLMYPTKGREGEGGTWAESTLTAWPELVLYVYVDHTAKLQLYSERIAELATPRLYLPADADGELMKGLSGQILEEYKPGHTRWKVIPWDHYGDCIKLGLVSWWTLRAHYEGAAEDVYTEQEENHD